MPLFEETPGHEVMRVWRELTMSQWPASHTSPGHTMRGPDSNDHPSYEVTLPCLPPIHCVLEKTHLSCEKKGNITLMKYGSQNQ